MPLDTDTKSGMPCRWCRETGKRQEGGRKVDKGCKRGNGKEEVWERKMVNMEMKIKRAVVARAQTYH